MKGLILATFAGLLVCVSSGPYVLRFQAKKEEYKPRLQTFSFKNCAPSSKEIGVVNSLSFMPDPLSFPGPLQVAFDLTIKSTLDAPLKADVYLGKKVGDTWIKIPCIGFIGSCTYDDLCDILAPVTCPDPFVQAGVPCNCPFNAGHYVLPQTEFDVDADLFPTGDYHGQANLTYGDAFVGCYDMYFSFA